jgi:hypothetical protein
MWGAKIYMMAVWDRNLSNNEFQRVADGESPLTIPGCTSYFDLKKGIDWRRDRDLKIVKWRDKTTSVFKVIKPDIPLNWIDIDFRDI